MHARHEHHAVNPVLRQVSACTVDAVGCLLQPSRHVPKLVIAMLEGFESGFQCFVVVSHVEHHFGLERIAEGFVGPVGVQGLFGQVVERFVDVLADESVGVGHGALHAFGFEVEVCVQDDAAIGLGCCRVVWDGKCIDEPEVVIGSHDFGLCDAQCLIRLRAFSIADVVDDNVILADA